ncbi:MAG: hypothetical protein ACXVQS_07140 [Actinomycetota bacterium]
MAADPASVWKLVQRADELVKYARNRDPATAYAQARATLDEAETLAAELVEPAAAGLRAQIETRRADIARYESENAAESGGGSEVQA